MIPGKQHTANKKEVQSQKNWKKSETNECYKNKNNIVGTGKCLQASQTKLGR